MKLNMLEDEEEQQEGFSLQNGVLNFEFKPYKILSFCVVTKTS